MTKEENIEQGRQYLEHALEDLLDDEILHINMDSEKDCTAHGPRAVTVNHVTKTFDIVTADRKTATIQITQKY